LFPSLHFLPGICYFVELFPVLLSSPDPEEGLLGGSGVWVSVPERSLWLPPIELSSFVLLVDFLGVVGVFFILLSSPDPEEGLLGGSGV